MADHVLNLNGGFQIIHKILRGLHEINFNINEYALNQCKLDERLISSNTFANHI